MVGLEQYRIKKCDKKPFLHTVSVSDNLNSAIDFCLVILELDESLFFDIATTLVALIINYKKIYRLLRLFLYVIS